MNQHRTAQRKKYERAGRRAETIAAIYYRLIGYSILATRFRTPSGEIDLVAKRGQRLAFIEVKQRRTISQALEAVDTTSSRRISAAADWFLTRRPDLAEAEMGYDIVAIAGWRLHRLTDAWREGE